MAGSTTYYKLAYFDYKDRLDSAINVQKEVSRFMFIDSQLYGMYKVFGNGTVSGWMVYDASDFVESGIYAGVTIGSGIIKYSACQNFLPGLVGPLPPNSNISIYAVLKESAMSSREVTFVYGNNLENSNTIKIANVITGSSSISSIDNTVKQYIGFAQYILDEINDHKHRGIPTKINLETETKNELPGARLEDFAASKMTIGKVEKERIPTIEHSELENAGVLSHAALDTFVDTLSDSSNLGLLGEVASTNLLRTVISLKYEYNDIDNFLLNEVTYLPTVDTTLPDYDNSTALIDITDGYVVGLPVEDRLTYFFTDNFSLPSNLSKVIVTSNKSVPPGGDITFGINTTNSTNWYDYQPITENNVSLITNPVSDNIRLGIRFTTSSGISPDPYSELFEDFIDFIFVNSGATADFHFRIRFYNDAAKTDLHLTAFSSSNQEGWIIDDSHSIPSTGYEISSGDSVSVTYFPTLSQFESGKIYYLLVDAFNGTSFVSEVDSYMFTTSGDTTSVNPYGHLPFIRNLAFMVELEHGRMTRLNI